MFGVIIFVVDIVCECFKEWYGDDVEVYVFYVIGYGGKMMEKMVREEELDVVLDLIMMEVVDFVVGGVMSVGEERMMVVVERGILYLVLLGVMDMVNFGVRDMVLEWFKDRNLVEYNVVVIVMRMNKEEVRDIGRFMVERLKNVMRLEVVRVVILRGGISLFLKCGE